MSRYFGRACQTCRRRGRRCDRRLPFCQTCETKGLTCEGYAIRWSGLASRGRFANKDAPVLSPAEKANAPRTPTSRRSSRQQSQSSISDPVPSGSESGGTLEIASDHVEEAFLDQEAPEPLIPAGDELATLWLDAPDIRMPFDEVDVSNLPVAAEDGFTHPSLQYSLPTLAGVSDEVKYFLQYYIAVVAPKLCVDHDCADNPYYHYILPLALEVRSLLYACVSLAVCQYTVRYPEIAHGNDFWKFKGKAMKRLQEDLYSESRAKHPATLATVLILCLCEICHGGFSDFEAHFRGSKRLTELRGADRTPNGFVEQYLAWLDIMAATSHPRTPIFSISDITTPSTTTAVTQAPPPPQWSFDVIPCPINQFECIYQIISLYRTQPDPAHPTPEILAQVAEIKTTLLTRPIQSQQGVHWLHLTEAYRFAIILYLLRLFRCATDEDDIAWLVSSVIWHAKSTPPASGWSDQLLWPLFHAGLELQDARRQDWLLDRMGCMRVSGGFANVDSALRILKRVWSADHDEPVDYLSLTTGDGMGGTILLV